MQHLSMWLDELIIVLPSTTHFDCKTVILSKSLTTENKGKSILLRKHLGLMAFLHITRLTFGKRFIDSNGNFDKEGKELKDILDENVKSGAKKSFFGFIPGYNYIFKDEVNALDKHIKRSIDFTNTIMEEHTRARLSTGHTKSHFVDAMLTRQEEYELSEDTITGLLWVC